MRFGFVGPSYVSRSIIADNQRCVNLYPEVIESGKGKSVVALHGTPGLTVFATVTDGPIRALFKSDENGERVLAVGREVLYDITNAGAAVNRGTIKDDVEPATIAFNRTQYMIVSGGQGYILTGNTLAQITDPDFPGAKMVAYVDGYFVVIKPETQEIWISGQYDGNSWNALDFAPAEAAPDDLISIFADHGELWLFGSEKTEVFYNSGNPDFPFERIQGAIIEQGIEAAYSVAKVGNGLMFLGGNSRGGNVVYRTNGFIPERVSTHAVEFALNNYSNTSDATAFSYEEEGHEFYVLNLPTAKATWVYDTATGLWHERGYWQAVTGYTASLAANHVHAYGRHLVGDRSAARIYTQSLDTYDDNADAIRRLRRCPHLSKEHKVIFYNSLVVDMEVGVGLQTGQGSDPQATLRFSNDGGKTWHAPRLGSLGAVGNHKMRVKFDRLGSARDRVFEFVISDPVKVAIVDAYLDVEEGFS